MTVIGSEDTRIKDIPVGSNPWGIGVNNVLNKVYVTNRNSDTVSVIDGMADTVIKTVSVGIAPNGICANPSTSKVYVANSGDDTVSVINSITDEVMRIVNVGDDPGGVAVNSKTNRIYVTSYAGNSISVIDGATNNVTGTIKVGDGPVGVGVNQVYNKVYVGNASDDTVSVISGSTDTVTALIRLVKDSTPLGVCVNSAASAVYVTCYQTDKLDIINTASDTLGTEVGVGQQPVGLDVDTQTGRVYVADYGTDPGTVSIIHDPPGETFYFAEGTTRPNFDPYICVQNTGAEAADVKITYMLGDSTIKEQNIKVAPLSRSTAHPSVVLGSANDSSHDFSAKVECTNGQKIVAERPMYFNYNGVWTGGHDVIGATGPNLNAYFAEGSTRSGFEPYVCLQNPNDEGTFVKIRFGPDTYREIMMAPHSRATVSCAAVMGTGDDPWHDFYINIESIGNSVAIRQPIIAERPMYFNYGGAWTGGSDIVGPPSPSSVFYFAEGTTR
ncbi:MAG: YncE family protein, partial [Candidatus Geothermincolia bacterium]